MNEKEKYLNTKGLTIETFKEQVETSENKKAKIMLDFILYEADINQFKTLVDSFIKLEEEGYKKDTYYLNYNGETIDKFKANDPKEAYDYFYEKTKKIIEDDHFYLDDIDETFYIEIYKTKEEKLLSGEDLDEDEIINLIDEYEIYQEEGEELRWTRFMTSVIEVDGETYSIDWQRGLTEYQDDIYDNQPKPCNIEEKEVVIKETIITLKKED